MGPMRSEKTGSVSHVEREDCKRNVAWPIQVIATPSPRGADGTRTGGTETSFGHGAGRLVNRQRTKSRNPRPAGAPGWKNVFPVKWSEGGIGTVLGVN